MAKTRHVSQTPATQWLQRHQIPYTSYAYDYVEHGGARHAAQALGLELHRVAKTLVMEDEHALPLIVVMHGDQEVSVKNLARQSNTKKIAPCAPAVAERHTGYRVGGTSPFGTRKRLPVWIEASLLNLPTVYINGGRRGFLVAVAPEVLTDLLGARAVHVAV